MVRGEIILSEVTFFNNGWRIRLVSSSYILTLKRYELLKIHVMLEYHTVETEVLGEDVIVC